MEYNKFINDINDGLIVKIHLELLSYAHYKNIEITTEKAINPKPNSKEKYVNKITIYLTNDKKESAIIFNDFKEYEKFFKIKGKGSFTFKELWKDIIVKEVIYK